ncbi:MAG: hypothetical protein L0241_20955 [Planctomycetia bacterium]|nr:hypothetical protein [Planctomycetia bacterium]
MTVVSSAGLLSGGVCAGVADALGRNPYLWFLIGFFIASGLLPLVFVSDSAVLRRLRRIKELHEQGLITQREAAQLRRALLRWYSERMFGRLDAEEFDDTKSNGDSLPPPT